MEGVATVVTKLFNIILPDYAIFGEKDFQQLLLIKSFVKDLNIPVKIISSKTIRDKDGLALSSRNIKLNPDERNIATEINKSLIMGVEKILCTYCGHKWPKKSFYDHICIPGWKTGAEEE